MSLKSGGLHEKQQLGIWEPSQHLLEDKVKPRKQCVEAENRVNNI
jgi:hypothetical protein